MNKTAIIRAQIELRRGLPFAVEIPNGVTTRTLRTSRCGRGVKHFVSKLRLYADLGL